MEQLRGKGRAVTAVLVGLMIAGLATTVILLALAFVLLKLRPDVGTMEIAIVATYVISCFFGGWYCGRKMERRKFLWGCLLGVLYFLLLFLISGMGDREVQSGLAQSMIALAACAGGGTLGGMLAR